MKRAGKKIFIVDDEPLMRSVMKDALTEIGYDVVCFANAHSCLTAVEKTGCNLVISDVKMPGMDGLELLKQMNRIAPWISVIMITAYGNIQMAVNAVKTGAADFIEKPFDTKTFLKKVHEVLSRSEYEGYSKGLKLTKTEKKVLKLILDGRNNKEIAAKTGCALRTVEFHHTNIYRKFGVDNSVALTKKAIAMFHGA